MRFRVFRSATLFALFVIAVTGCSSSPTRRIAAKPEPPLLDGGEGSATIVQAPPSTKITFADRHPLFSRPKQYYDSTNSNAVAKTARATFIGVPSGIIGEFKQIVAGQPQIRTN